MIFPALRFCFKRPGSSLSDPVGEKAQIALRLPGPYPENPVKPFVFWGIENTLYSRSGYQITAGIPLTQTPPKPFAERIILPPGLPHTGPVMAAGMRI